MNLDETASLYLANPGSSEHFCKKQNLFTAYHTLHNPKSKLPLKLKQEKKGVKL